MTNTTKIGWIGLGLMGNPMSQQLLKAGYPVTVYNRHKDKEAELKEQGATTAATPKRADRANGCDHHHGDR
jgi:3-hydroxyisobutyrate dehydrogenase